MNKIPGLKEGKTYSNIYKEKWTQPWPMGSEIYLEVHENPKPFFNNSSPILLEPLAPGFGDWSLPREDCIRGGKGVRTEANRKSGEIEGSKWLQEKRVNRGRTESENR